ncbi:MAG: chemotaxis protein CheA [Leptospiraceae bacterium]|nr:chemotaxis protein CheA [Leptospiraceae bacterium]MCP5493688.1 chemotaxis protein CheA [Leptospiraceae bacterium]
MNTDNKKILEDLVQSSKEILESIESLLIKLEKSYERKESLSIDTINNLFRQFHTLKGNSGFFDFHNIESLAHTAETILNDLRNLTIEINYELIDSIIETRDFLLNMIEHVERVGDDSEFESETKSRIKRLEILQSRQSRKIKTDEPEKTKPPFGIFEDEPEDEKVKPPFGIFEDGPIEEQLQRNIEYVEKKDTTKKDIRIDTQKLDVLIDTIGELVIAESLVTENPDLNGLYLENFSRSSEHLKKIVKSLQDIALGLRMVPIEGIYQKMERLVRDISRKKGKKVNLELQGTDTEVDKNILENISDPLMHLIRNAIDHGLEDSETRKKLGKPECGEIKLEAFNAGSNVVINVIDDGKGLDKKKILQKAIRQGLVKDSDTLKDEEIVDLIFIPGFTTTEQLTETSGRGVGMDVVKKNIMNLNGEIQVLTNYQKGTTFTIKLPLTLSIIDGMIVTNKSKYYIIPAVDIVETFELKEQKFDMIDDYNKVLRYREKVVPIVSIENSINENYNDSFLNSGSELYLIIVESKKQYLGLILDNIIVNQSIVIKSLPEMFKNIKVYNGCTILGNGKIAFILDIKYMVENYSSISKHDKSKLQMFQR